MATKKLKKVGLKSTVKVNSYSIIVQAVENALNPIRLERFFKHYSSTPTQEQLAVISEKGADAVMLELCEVLKFED